MRNGHRLGRRFGWLWGAYGTSALGTWLAFGAFPLIAIRVLHAGPAEVAALSSVGGLRWARPWRCRSARGWSSAASGRC
ncbi:hypothetical protein GCM10020000_83490 [Streptomyces olivoverticillatus]